MDTLEQIEGCRIALKSHWEGKNEDIQRGVIDALCTLAKRGLVTRKRQIAEAPKDGTHVLAFHTPSRMWCIIFWDNFNEWFVLAGSFNPVGEDEFTHFIPLSALEEE